LQAVHFITQGKVMKCTACNVSGTAMTMKFYKVPSGGVVSDSYLVIQDRAVGGKYTDECPEVVGQVLDAGDMIYCHPSAAAQLSVILDVAEAV
jgi:hypothetical protein